MAVESPTNCWTNALAKIATALANSARFQAAVYAADVTEATAKIFGEIVGNTNDGHAYTPEELADLKGYGQVYSADEGAYGREFEESRMVAYGTAIIYIERLVTEAEAKDEVPLGIERWWENRIGDLMKQVEDYLETNSGPRILKNYVSAGPGYNDRKQWAVNGMWQGVELTLEWRD